MRCLRTRSWLLGPALTGALVAASGCTDQVAGPGDASVDAAATATSAEVDSQPASSGNQSSDAQVPVGLDAGTAGSTARPSVGSSASVQASASDQATATTQVSASAEGTAAVWSVDASAAVDSGTDVVVSEAGASTRVSASTTTSAGDGGNPGDASASASSTASVVPVELPPPFEGVAGALTDWETYQGDRSHSGAVGVLLDEADFSVRWSLSKSTSNPSSVTVSGARAVFASNRQLFCVNVFSGEQLWMRDFSTRDGLSPPAIAVDRVYVQTSGHEDSFLWSLDAETGEILFQSAYGNQWSSYLAPTVDDGGVYVAGGYYGGMYAFDAETGASRWFVALNQYDLFTPTVTDDQVLAYTGDYAPSLTLVDKATGALAAQIPDPNFDWSGWSMNTVAVAGSNNGSIALHDGRLLRFDHASESISWERAESFVGQPAVAAGLIYALNGNMLDVSLEQTGAHIWGWDNGSAGTLQGRVIVTPTHVFLSTGSQTFAISIATHQQVWSYPVGGELTLAQGALLISTDTSLVAIDLIGDTDGDALPDAWELAHGGDFDPALDQDADGLTNRAEYAALTDPLDADSDDDGLSDGRELELGTLPLVDDTDLDLLTDGAEVLVHHTNPLRDDTDGDEIDDSAEIEGDLAPTDASDANLDSDADGYSDKHEIYAGTDRLDALEFPQLTDWGMIQGNARHDGYQPALLTASRFSVRWSTTFEYPVVGAAVGAGHVYVTGNGATLALDSSNGEVAWLRDFSSLVLPSWPGPFSVSAPSYANSLVYVHTGGHEDTALWALDPATGAHVFHGTHYAQWPSFGQPTLSGHRAYINGSDSGVVALDALSTGVLAWSARAPWEDYWEPAVADGQVYLPSGGGLSVLNADTGVSVVGIADSVPVVTPVVGRRGNVLFGGAALVSFDVVRQRRAWSSQHAGLGEFGLPAVGNGRAFAVRGGVLEVFNEVSGRRVWTWAPSGDTLTSNVVLTASHVFVASEGATYAVDLRTHQLAYTHNFGGALSMGREGALFVVNGTRIDAIDVEGDTDGDVLPEWWERKNGGDLQPAADLDGDDLSALEEYGAGTDPQAFDSDLDGLSDGVEVALGTDPQDPDSDSDRLNDALEVNVYNSDPLAFDTDGDGIDDGPEAQAGFNPIDAADAAQDQDADGYTNAHEIFAGSNPRNASSVPQAAAWGMLQGNPQHNGYQPLALHAVDFAPAWTAVLSTESSAAAVSAQGVYVTSDHQLVALATATGAVQWTHTFANEPYLSTISAPSFGNELVYVHTGGHEGTALWAFDPEDGAYVFAGQHESQWPWFSAPTIYGDRAFMNGGYYGGIVAMDALYGSLLWDVGSPWADYWEPAVDAEGVYLVDAGDLKVFDHNTDAVRFTVDSSLPVQTPVIGQNNTVVIAGANLVAIDTTTWRERWRSRQPGVGDYGLPAIGNGRVYALREGVLEVFSEASGERLWTFSVDGDTLTSNLVLTASHLFVASATGTYAIDLATRQAVWSHPRGGTLALGPAGDLVIVDGVSVEMIKTRP